MAFVIRDAVFIDHSGNNVRIQGNVQSNSEGLRVFFVCLFVCFTPDYTVTKTTTTNTMRKNISLFPLWKKHNSPSSTILNSSLLI